MSRTSIGKEFTADSFFGPRLAGGGLLPRFGLGRPGFYRGPGRDEAAGEEDRKDRPGAEGRADPRRPAAEEPPVRSLRRFFFEITLLYYPERNGAARS
jgi:hypothetical protein